MRVLLLCLLLLLAGCDETPRGGQPMAVGEALGGVAAEGFARADSPRTFRFPEDHGPHPAFRNEWWYLTGNLRDAQGRRFGFQFTLFRIALAPEAPVRTSAWTTRDLYMAHFALSDIDGGRFYAFERFARGAAGLAGAALGPFRAWIEDWRLGALEGDGFPWRLQAAEGSVALELRLSPRSPVVLQGEAGLSRKSAEPGNASYYYSLPRLAAGGTLRLGEKQFEVDGLAWLDREWSTSALGEGQVGWDWFALHLDDGTDIMLYLLRREDGTLDPHSAGSVRLPSGEVVRLAAEDLQVETLEEWPSPRGGRYPLWRRLRLTPLDAELEIRPLLSGQELDLIVRYWEGAVAVSGQRADEPLSGQGYMELTGYAVAAGEE